MTLKVVGFPQATEFNKRIPKQKFYENLDISPALRRVFVDQIRLVYWRNKLAASTLNIAAGEAVAEIEVFEVRLNEPQLDEAVLKQIDKEIPYHMITRNGDGPYDLDYNLLVMKADNEYRDPRLLKDTIRNALNKAVGGKFFSDAQDSTSCLTAILYFEKSPDIKFKFDVAITTKNKNGNYMRLIHNKNVYALGLDQYTWNEVPNSHQVKDKADEIKEEGLWQEVRDRYLEKKNMYLSWQDRNHPSFVVYVETVNEVYNRYFNRGGGYSVQSIFRLR